MLAFLFLCVGLLFGWLICDVLGLGDRLWLYFLAGGAVLWYLIDLTWVVLFSITSVYLIVGCIVSLLVYRSKLHKFITEHPTATDREIEQWKSVRGIDVEWGVNSVVSWPFQVFTVICIPAFDEINTVIIEDARRAHKKKPTKWGD